MVASIVVFIDGKPAKSEYRKYKYKEMFESDTNIPELHRDDFEMMRQTIFRRFKRLLDEKQELPDLIIVDGGKGQLSSAHNVLLDLKIANKVTLIGLAKRLEEVFLVNQKLPLNLPKTSSSLRLIQQLRNEAHRFANDFNKELRTKRTIKSELDDIKHIGAKTKEKLLSNFGSVKGIKSATKEELGKLLTEKQLTSLLETLK
jgi:excinuclease ABC subunit C